MTLMMQKLCTNLAHQVEESTAEERLAPVITQRHVWPSTERQEALDNSYFGRLPNEILVQIFRFLSLYDLDNVRLVCRTFKMVVDLKEVWKNKHRIQSLINIDLNARWAQNGVTIAGGYGIGEELKHVYNPHGLYIDNDQTIYIADFGNQRIVEWKCDATSGQVVAGGNGLGNRNDQLNFPAHVIVDKETDSLIISDGANRRLMRWPRQNGTNGEVIISNIDCAGLTMDDQRFLYISDGEKSEVRRYRLGETNGIVVTGGNGWGNRLNQLSNPHYIFVDQDHSVYVSDLCNHRVMKWEKDAKEGTVVAGDQRSGNSLTQLAHPRGVIVDLLGTVYVADYSNNRVMRWCKGASQGSVVVGGNDQGRQPDQLNHPEGLTFDRHGNLYVADRINNRVQRFNIEKS